MKKGYWKSKLMCIRNPNEPHKILLKFKCEVTEIDWERVKGIEGVDLRYELR